MLVLHGAGVDHREPEACFEPMLEPTGLHRVYPDLPGMGGSSMPAWVRSTDDVLHLMLDFVHAEFGDRSFLLIGHSWGAYLAQAMAARLADQVDGLALVCPLLADEHDVPEHRVVEGDGRLGDDAFRGYFVVQTPAMLERYERHVAPSAVLVDEEALERIGENWGLSLAAPPYAGPTLVVAGRLDSTVGCAAAASLLEVHPNATATGWPGRRCRDEGRARRVRRLHGRDPAAPDDAYRGMSIFDCDGVEAARLSQQDPSVLAGGEAYVGRRRRPEDMA